MSRREHLREEIASEGLLVAPGAYDGISAKVIEAAGFSAGFISGSAVANSHLGVPDVGIFDLTANAERTRAIAGSTELPLIADADTGYGNGVNVYHTVETLEETGVAGIMIEDQKWPKRCGHMSGKSVVSESEMCTRIQAAVDAREDEDLVLMARTDAIDTHGIDEAVQRLEAYADTGADLLFPDAVRDREDIERVVTETSAPVVVNMGYGIRERPTTPLIPQDELEDLGVDVAIYPRLLTGAAAKGMFDALEALADSTEEANDRPDLTLNFADFTDLIGLPEFQEREARYADE